jgi:hypothetical protein
MTKLRAYLVALTVLAMAAAPLLTQSVGIRALGNSPAFAAAVAAPVGDTDNDNQDNGGGDTDNSNSNDNDNSSSNDNSDANNNNNNDNSGDNDEDNSDDSDNADSDNDNSGEDVIPAPPPAAAPAPAASACSTPGQEMSFQSGDGRVDVKVFPSLNQAVKFSIRLPVDPASVPPPPGTPVAGLLFQLLAESCDGTPIPTLPAEVNLGVHYADADAAGRNEANFTIARLDTTANQWKPSAKQASDPASNLTSATITEMGFYVLYEK